MKQNLLKIISMVLILSCVFIFAGCNEENSDPSTKNTEATHTVSDNPLVGTWQFTNEDGEVQTLFSYIFNENSTAMLAMGNVAYCSDLKLEKNESGKDTLTAQLYYNINGTYEYEISEDGKTMTLTNNDEKQVMKKVDDYKFMPEPPESPEVDEKLVGNWKDKEGAGITYTFNENGTMVNNSYGVMIVYAQYSAKDGKLSYTYNQGTDVDYTYDYSFNGDVLVIDKVEYVKE